MRQPEAHVITIKRQDGREKPRRALGAASYGAEAESFAKLVAMCPTDRDYYVYIRKSNPTAEEENENYLLAQQDIPILLARVGVPDRRIVKLKDDTGLSGALSRQYRKDLQRVFEDMGKGLVGTVVAIDVARLFRDSTDMGPAEFAKRAARNHVMIITLVDFKWILLDMYDEHDNQRFRDLAHAAAGERKNIRSRTMVSKEQMVDDGGYSGSPTPFGWAVYPKQTRHESADGKKHNGYWYIYEPHAKLKLEIMRLSLRPEIRSLRDLRDLLVRKGIKLPPFDPETAAASFSRWALCRATMKENGIIRDVTKFDSFTPSTQSLKGILVEPLTIGDRLYGSGKYGEWKAHRLERQAEEEDRVSDHMIREYRQYVDNRPELAICKTEDEIALYFEVAEKWSPIDMRAAHESKYEIELKNDACIRKPGRPRGSGHVQFNEWAGKVFCVKHGFDGEHFNHEIQLRRTPNRGEWACGKDYDAGEAEGRCASWADNDRLTRILNYHLYYHIHWMLEKDDTLIENVIAERDTLKRRIEDLRAEIAELDSERKRQMKRQDDLERRLDGMDESFRRQQVDKFFEENVRPFFDLLASRQRQLKEAEEDGSVEMSEQTAEEIRRELEGVVVDEKQLSDPKKRELIHTFVDSVEVLVPDYTGVCLIYFNWSPAITTGRGHQVTDTLIAPKPLSKDFRPFTAEEDEALRELYPVKSGASYATIKARLLPGRKIDAIIRRVYELGIRRPLRSKVWIDACRKSERAWEPEYNDALYMLVPDRRVLPDARFFDCDPEGEPIQNYDTYEVIVGVGQRELPKLPYEIREGLQVHTNHVTSKTPSPSAPPP